MPAPTQNSLLDEARKQLPILSRALLNAIQDELEAKAQHFPLQDAWRRLRGSFAFDFECAVLPLIEAAARGEDPIQKRSGSLETLSLVDERQALQDVAIAHVIHVVEEQCKPELHQLGNFFAALRGTARARKNENPLRPGLFAQALLTAFSGVQIEPERRYGLMHVAATPLSQGLLRLYSALCGELRAAELSGLVASHASKLQDKSADLRLFEGRSLNEPATLDGLSRRVEERNSRLQGLANAGAAGQEPVFIKATGPDMLNRLYEQILSDPRLLPPIKGLLGRLQVAVLRLARNDTSLLHRQDHPTWRLLNRVAAHGMAFDSTEDERLKEFLRFMEGELPLLIDSATPSAVLFQNVLSRVEAHLSAQAQERSQGSAQALATLERKELRPQWLELLREQIKAQTAGAPLAPKMSQFLHNTWTQIIVQAMVWHGRDAPEVAQLADWVDLLIDSLHELPDEAARQGLRKKLPPLLATFNAGCDAIKLPEAKREPVLRELMEQHGRLLRGLSALPEALQAQMQAAAAATPPQPMPSPEAQLSRLLEERESRQPDHWSNTKIDRGQLPTVPVQLYDQMTSLESQAAINQWMMGLQVGNWYHLFVQSEWLTAQVAWVSESRQFFLFVGQDPDERHSMTRGAIEKLLANGLITALDETNVVQRAVDTLMQDLNHGA
ncbi:hypothetical protein DBR47_06855 [Paucibacter sp. KBW04]|uniref:DUF1631 family protein n=1 Tax=Paucibacter sp. KBW04 TaxID=2153361 RepID=UPI000F5877E1|nr:DUF1631 family protein [Paucibacter sp. KBW04]RQO61838.1 hypothetical protein DBR47_06855 [Paucibacter sp. KBW04]